MRGATRRAWIKLYITGMLHGSVRWELDPAERATWVDMLLLAGECGKGGLICDNDGLPLPLQYIASHFNIPLKLLEKTLGKCIEQQRISRTDGVIRINNWATYQSEYERQRPSRQKQSVKTGNPEGDADGAGDTTEFRKQPWEHNPQDGEVPYEQWTDEERTQLPNWEHYTDAKVGRPSNRE